jgi:hypothetical protein
LSVSNFAHTIKNTCSKYFCRDRRPHLGPLPPQIPITTLGILGICHFIGSEKDMRRRKECIPRRRKCQQQLHSQGRPKRKSACSTRPLAANVLQNVPGSVTSSRRGEDSTVFGNSRPNIAGVHVRIRPNLQGNLFDFLTSSPLQDHFSDSFFVLFFTSAPGSRGARKSVSSLSEMTLILQQQGPV